MAVNEHVLEQNRALLRAFEALTAALSGNNLSRRLESKESAHANVREDPSSLAL
jgi:hypothetical protein